MHDLLIAWNWLRGNEIAFSVVAVIFLLLAGFVASMICKFFLLNIVRRFILHTKNRIPTIKIRVSPAAWRTSCRSLPCMCWRS